MKRILPLVKLMVLGLLVLITSNSSAQLMSWQFGSPGSAGNETSVAATFVDPHITSSPLTRGAGLLSSSFVRSFSSTDFTISGTKTTAVSNNDYLEVGLTVLPGSTVSLYNIDFHLRRSSTTAAANTFRWMYSLNNGGFVEIGSADVTVAGTNTTDGDDQVPVILAGIPALQNLPSGTTVSLRMYLWGATTSTSTVAFGRYAASNTSPSLAIGGRVTPTGTSSLLGWQFGSPASTGYEATYVSTATATGLSSSILSRGAGIPGDAATGLTRGFTAANFTPVNSVKSDAVTNGNYYQFTLTPSSGYSASLSTIDARFRRTSAAPGSYRWMYSLDGNSFTEIGSSDVSFMSTFDGTDQPQIDLSSITALQQIPFGTTVTFRVYAWGNTTLTGTFAIGRYNVAGTTVNSLEVQGKVNASSATDYFRSKQTGNWQTVSTWESSVDNLNWMNATLVPTNAAANISIGSGHTITSNADISVANTSVAGSLVIASNASIAVPATKTLTITGSVVLKSDATGTASITASQGSIVGDVTAERYLNNKRAFRFIAPGLNTSSSIYANWQNSGSNIANVGTHITGDAAGGNGFDATASGASSLYAFDNASQLWKAYGIAQSAPYNNTSTNILKAGEAYRLFVRGDRSMDLGNNASSGQTTLLTKGTPLIGNYTFNTASNPVALNGTVNNWNLIGNPYLSEVDWKSPSLTSTNLSTAFYIWDLSLGTRGAYAYFDAADNSFTGSATQYIQSGQAIFVQTTGNSPSLTFTEAAKSNGHNNITAFRNQNTVSQLSVKLSYDEAGQAIVADQANAVFNHEARKGKDRLDIEKFTNLDENLAFTIDGSSFIKDARPAMQGTDELQLAVWQLKKRNYHLSISTNNIDVDELYLEDHYKNTSTPLTINQTSIVPFDVNDDAGSSAKDRFKIVLKKNTTTPFASINMFSATMLGNIDDAGFRLLLSSKTNGFVNIKVNNILGQQFVNKKFNVAEGQQCITIPASNLGNGVYLIEVSQANERVTLKAIKN